MRSAVRSVEAALFVPSCPKGPLGSTEKGLCLRIQAIVAGDAGQVVGVIALAPAQHLRAAEARIGAQQDTLIEPSLTQALDQQRQNCRRMLDPVDLARSQAADQ